MDYFFADSRGSIEMILPSCKIGSISRIYSRSGTIRARHFHKDDYHYCYVNYGSIYYYEMPIDISEDFETYKKHLIYKNINFRVVKMGEIVYTAPYVLHEMIFKEDTSFDCYSKHSRDHKSYEEDTFRFNFSLKDLYDGIPYRDS